MEFQDKFKKASRLNELDWDKDAMWDSIEKELPPKKKKRRFILLFWGLSVLIVSSIILLGDFVSNEPFGNNPVVAHDKENIPATEVVTSTKSGLDINQREGSIIDRPNEGSNGLNSKMINSGTESFENEIQSENHFFSYPKVSQTIKPEFENVKNSFIVSNSSNQKRYQEAGQGTLSPSWIEIQKTSPTKNNVGQLILEIANIDAPQITPFYIDRKLELLDRAIIARPIIKPVSSSNFTLAFKTYVGFTNHDVLSLNPANDEFVDLHSSSKRIQESLGAEILIRKNLMGHFSLGLGLNYFSSFEWYNGQSIRIDKDVIATDSASYYTINGLKSFVGGDLTKSTSTTTNFKSPVRRHFIDIPLELVFDFELFSMTIEAFAKYNFNISHRLSGRTYSNKLNLLESSNSEIQDMYRSTGVNSYSYGLDALYSFNKNYAGAFGFYYRKQLISNFNSSIGVDETYSSYGISLGLIYKL